MTEKNSIIKYTKITKKRNKIENDFVQNDYKIII